MWTSCFITLTIQGWQSSSLGVGRVRASALSLDKIREQS
jgi:hypothetical protein